MSTPIGDSGDNLGIEESEKRLKARLRDRLEEIDLSLASLADRTGDNYKNVLRWISGSTMIPAHFLVRFVAATETGAEWLLTGRGSHESTARNYAAAGAAGAIEALDTVNDVIRQLRRYFQDRGVEEVGHDYIQLPPDVLGDLLETLLVHPDTPDHQRDEIIQALNEGAHVELTFVFPEVPTPADHGLPNTITREELTRLSLEAAQLSSETREQKSPKQEDTGRSNAAGGSA